MPIWGNVAVPFGPQPLGPVRSHTRGCLGQLRGYSRGSSPRGWNLAGLGSPTPREWSQCGQVVLHGKLVAPQAVHCGASLVSPSASRRASRTRAIATRIVPGGDDRPVRYPRPSSSNPGIARLSPNPTDIGRGRTPAYRIDSSRTDRPGSRDARAPNQPSRSANRQRWFVKMNQPRGPSAPSSSTASAAH